jgi:hypothetical protein
MKLAVIAFAVAGVLNTSAFAEDVPKGLGHPNGIAAPHWYDSACCNKRDCEPLPVAAVKMVAEGYHVRYRASLGLLVDVLVPWSEAKVSQDGQNHGCSNPVKFLCFYASVGA